MKVNSGLTGALLVLVLAACGTTVDGTASPSASPSPSSSTPTASPSASTPTASPSASTPTASPSSSTPTVTPSAVLPPGLLGKDITLIPTTARVAALTFDAGANAAGLPAILAALKAAGVRGTFLLTGEFTRSFPTQSRAIVGAGHSLGNHSDTHPHFPDLSVTGQIDEVTAAAASIRAVTGVPPGPFFRFPYGDRTTATIATVNGQGYLCVRWTVDTLGWKGTSGGQTTTTVLSRVLAELQPGEIVLMHVGSNPEDGSTVDADALPSVIAALKARGYSFVTLAALLH